MLFLLFCVALLKRIVYILEVHIELKLGSVHQRSSSIFFYIYSAIYFYSACRQIDAQRRKERSEAHLYMPVHVVLEEIFQNHHGHDLFDYDKVEQNLRQFRVKKADSVTDLLKHLAETLVRSHNPFHCLI